MAKKFLVNSWNTENKMRDFLCYQFLNDNEVDILNVVCFSCQYILGCWFKGEKIKWIGILFDANKNSEHSIQAQNFFDE